uniref:Uncharacterized protein n=1 Tax=Leersia perrieri TaxID=77586 RepID=A0A0D9XHV0_9ORYZ
MEKEEVATTAMEAVACDETPVDWTVLGSAMAQQGKECWGGGG